MDGLKNHRINVVILRDDEFDVRKCGLTVSRAEIIPADLPDTGHTRAHGKIKYSAEFHRSSPSLPYTPRYPCPFKPWNDVTTFTSSTSTFLIASIGSKTRASNLTISLEQKYVHNFLSRHSSL